MMKKVLVATGIVALSLTACVSTVKNGDRNIASWLNKGISSGALVFGNQSGPRLFEDADVLKLASSAKLNLVDARVIIDNDAAFDSKLAMIKRATREIRMSYFIYGDDDSSSLISNALIERAKDGVKVKLLVDFITNYKYLDHYQMMVNEGKGKSDKNNNIQIHFYNFPSAKIISDAKYMTIPCPPKSPNPTANECKTFKAGLMQNIPTVTTPFSKMFLAGLYGKSGTALKISLGYGGGVDPEELKKMKADTTDAQEDVIFNFFELVRRSMDGDLMAKIKISAALASSGATLNPVLNELTGRLPFLDTALDGTAGISHFDEWDHLTDYTHHKLVAVDGREFQLGGRNVEDSYHMKSRLGTKGKYIFVDTDFYGVTTDGGTNDIETSFDKMFNFSQMVADISRVQQIVPIDMAVNTDALKMATGSCLQNKVQLDQLGQCIEQNIAKMPNYKNQNVRMAAAQKEMMDSIQRYNSDYVPKKDLRDNWKNQPYVDGIDHLSEADKRSSGIYYLENVPFNDGSGSGLRRHAGARIGAEADFNKNIHAAWYRGLENVCRVSRGKDQDKRVIFHSAYLFMPSGLMYHLSKMMNGDYGDCSHVRITFLTNSMDTTDLNVINIFARYQMSELFKRYASLEANDRQINQDNSSRRQTRLFPKLDYFEYNKSVGSGVSLHTKLTVLGDDIVIGSANADVRSYYMDTNNAVLIRNAYELKNDYIQFIDTIISNSARTTPLAGYFTSISAEQLQADNRSILDKMLERFDTHKKVTPAKQVEILRHIDLIGAKITQTTRKLLNFRQSMEQSKENNSAQSFEKELNDAANGFDDLFKVL